MQQANTQRGKGCGALRWRVVGRTLVLLREREEGRRRSGGKETLDALRVCEEKEEEGEQKHERSTERERVVLHCTHCRKMEEEAMF